MAKSANKDFKVVLPPQMPWEAQLFCFSAPSRPELVKGLPSNPVADFDAYAQKLAARAPERCRLAVVAKHTEELVAKIERAKAFLTSNEKPTFNLANTIFYGEIKPNPGQVAWMFPGFGVQYPAMLQGLYARHPKIRRWFDGLDDALRMRSLQNPLLFESSGATRAVDLTYSVEAITLVSVALSQLLETAAVPKHVLVGHSFGEYTSLLSAGAVPDIEDVLNLLHRIRRALKSSKAPDCAMISVRASSRELAEHLVAGAEGAVSIALDNCPQQVVLCGLPSAVDRIADTLRERGEVFFRLPELDQPVHTPAFPLSTDMMSDIVSTLPVSPPLIPTYCCTSASPFPAQPHRIRERVVAAWRETVRFRETIETMHREGVSTFIDVGPNSHLAGFVRDTLRGSGVTVLHANEPSGTVAPYLATLGRLFVAGHDVNLNAGSSPAQNHFKPEFVQDKQICNAAASHTEMLDLVTDALASIMEWDGSGEISPDEGFFDLGLDSMGAVALVERLQQETGLALSPITAFNYPTAEALASYLEQQQSTSSEEAVPTSDLRQDRRSEPIAVIGVGCRLPGGVNSPDAFWNLLVEGRDAITEIPADRWDVDEFCNSSTQGSWKLISRCGGFVDDIRGFDAGFFGISAREALTLDPQHRLLLETSWEAIEHAALAPKHLEHGRTGVFVGISGNDYIQRLSPATRLEIRGYIGTGNVHSTAAGRISHTFGLSGPCLAIDTACSSSLVAIHLACQSIRNGESDIALAGGVNALLSPETSLYLSRSGALSPSGRCKAFDASADGYVRSEGCGVVVLKPLQQAQQDGDNVMAVIRGSAIGHDGRTSGLTVPNGPAQQAVIREALADAGVDPAQVSYVEAHGTGTSLGDPIEAEALGGVFSASHDAENPLQVGSVKSNVGHLESAGGVAGLIKCMLQLAHKELVPSLHFDTPNPKIAWNQLHLNVCDRVAKWGAAEGNDLVAGLSSFGISGTNAHIVISAPPTQKPPVAPDDQTHILTLSARTPSALSHMATIYREFLERETEPNIADICFTTNTGRAHFPWRIALPAHNRDELIKALSRPVPTRTGKPRVAFLFTGQGASYAQLGRNLFATEPHFRTTLETCDSLLRAHVPGSMLEALFSEDDTRLKAPSMLQPALFSVAYALADLWRHWGVEPSFVAGHSLGEYVAACVGGVFHLEDAIKLVASRGRLVESLPSEGGMLSVGCKTDKLREVLNLQDLGLELAAINGPEQIVLSGNRMAIDKAEKLLKSSEISCTPLSVSHAFHSAAVDPILEMMRAEAAQISMHTSRIPLVSTLTGNQVGASIATPEHWCRHLRDPVLFRQAVESLVEAGADLFLEIGGKPVLSALGRACAPDPSLTWISSFRLPYSESDAMKYALAALYEAGVHPDWDTLHAGSSARRIPLPVYPFEHEEYWIERDDPLDRNAVGTRQTNSFEHPLLGARMDLPGASTQVRFEGGYSGEGAACLADYRLFGRLCVPPAFYFEMIAATHEMDSHKPINLHSMIIHQDAGPKDDVQTVAESSHSSVSDISIYAAAQTSRGGLRSWNLVASAQAGDVSGKEGVVPAAMPPLPNDPIRHEIAGAEFYRTCRAQGFDYGTRFQLLDAIRLGEKHAQASIVLCKSMRQHPALFRVGLIEACLQLSGALLMSTSQRPFRLISADQYTSLGLHDDDLRITVTISEDSTTEQPTLDAWITNSTDCKVLLCLSGLHFVAMDNVAEPTSSTHIPILDAVSSDAKQDTKNLLDYLEVVVGQILGVPAGRSISQDQPLAEMGLDSMMAVKLGNELQNDLGITLSANQFMGDITLNGLVDVILSAKRQENSTVADDWVEGEL